MHRTLKAENVSMTNKQEFAKWLQEIDPKWRQKIQIIKELELETLRKLTEKVAVYNYNKEEDLLVQRQLDEEIKHTKFNIMNNIVQPQP